MAKLYLYSIEDTQAGVAGLRQLEESATRTDYTSLAALSLDSKTVLLAYNSGERQVDSYIVDQQGIEAGPSNNSIEKGATILNTFVLGNQSYLCAYYPGPGFFDIYRIGEDLDFSKPYRFYRNHELSVSQNFTTVKVFAQLGQVVCLGYRDDGYVAIYTVNVTVSSSAPGVPPLLMVPAWSHQWAAGWKRFAFFQFGGENFFLKTNVKKLNVNIDHVMDTLSLGTAEVGTMLQGQLPGALDLTCVEPISLGAGEPHFLTYDQGSGELTLNRIHGNCLGWSQIGRVDAPKSLSLLQPLGPGLLVLS